MPRAVLGAAIGLFGAVAVAYAAEKASPPLDAEMVEAGRIVYQQHCTSCHGARAEGAPNWQQPDAQGELPAPPHDAQGHTWKHSDAMLYRLVMRGWRDPFNKTDRLTMPAFSEILSPMEARTVITYLKTLWTPEQRRFQQEESRKSAVPARNERMSTR